MLPRYYEHQRIPNQRRRFSLLALLTFIIAYVLNPARMFFNQAENKTNTVLATIPEITPNNSTPLLVAPTNDEVAGMFERYFATSAFSTQDMDTLNRLALTHNKDPEAMFAATKDAIAQRCTYTATNTASMIETQLGAILPEADEDGDGLTISANLQGSRNTDTKTFSSKFLTFSYDKDWYNTFKDNLIESVCSNTVLNEARRVFARFVELTNQGLNLAQTHIYMGAEAVYKRAELKASAVRDTISAISTAGSAKVDMTVAFDATKISGLTPEEQNDVWPAKFNLRAQGDTQVDDNEARFSFSLSGTAKPKL